MISAITGELRAVEQDRLHLQVGPLLIEMLVPAADVPLLQAGGGQGMPFQTIFYSEGAAAGGGGLGPRLGGSLRPPASTTATSRRPKPWSARCCGCGPCAPDGAPKIRRNRLDGAAPFGI